MTDLKNYIFNNKLKIIFFVTLPSLLLPVSWALYVFKEDEAKQYTQIILYIVELYFLVAVIACVFSLFSKKFSWAALYIAPVLAFVFFVSLTSRHFDDYLNAARFHVNEKNYKELIKKLPAPANGGPKIAAYGWAAGGGSDCGLYLMYDESDEMGSSNGAHLRFRDIVSMPSDPIAAMKLEQHFYLVKIRHTWVPSQADRKNDAFCTFD